MNKKGGLKGGKKASELVIKGKPSYIKHMFEHLRKEHPSTRRRMRMG